MGEASTIAQRDAQEVSDMKPFIIALSLTGALALFGWVGNEDYEEAKQAQAEYCEMVQKGYWPDYEGKYAQWCIE
jgi:hypothetical protein